MRQNDPQLVLASSSPRRREILQAAGIPFEVVAPSVPEVQQEGESPERFVCRVAMEKAVAALDQIAGSSNAPLAKAPILGADTVVVIDDHTLGKPASADEARSMLRLLSGKEHRVLTGLCLLTPPRAWPCSGSELPREIQLASTVVRFSLLTEEEIEQYVSSGEPFDKAGAYGIQGLASKFIDTIQGCYFNVVGLPISLVYQMLKRFRSVTPLGRAQQPRENTGQL
jgi:septum formation protein